MAVSSAIALRRVLNIRSKALFMVLACFILVYATHSKTKEYWTPSCEVPHSAPDGGDCQALGGPRRPRWACYSTMRNAVDNFLLIYKRRPLKRNVGGMRLQHSFALYFILREIRPRIVIESGARRGHSTWIIRKALPHARIITLDPKPPSHRLSKVTYYVGNDFVDFGEVDWKQLDVNPEETLIFLDDHQDAFKRMFTQNRYGFRHFILEDNYDYPHGDAQSLKWICQTNNRSTWPGFVMDNFGVRNKMTWEEHLVQSTMLNFALETYYLFPALAPRDFDKFPRFYPRNRPPPIIQDREEYHSVFNNFPEEELLQGGNLAYAAIRPSSIKDFEYD